MRGCAIAARRPRRGRPKARSWSTGTVRTGRCATSPSCACATDAGPNRGRCPATTGRCMAAPSTVPRSQPRATGWRSPGSPRRTTSRASSWRSRPTRARVSGHPSSSTTAIPWGALEVLLLDDGSALVSWLEATPAGSALRVRRVRAGGQRDAAVTVLPAGTPISNGFPQMVRAGEQLVLAWTAERVRTAVMPVP